MQDKILVLLSTYNGEQYLECQLNSILLQKNIHLHILIRDDGSTDNTRNILLQYKNKYNNDITLYLEKNIGCADSFACLLKYASNYIHDYNFFCFSDQDDFWFENKLSTAVTVLKNSPFFDKVPITYCSNLFNVDKDLQNPQLHITYEIIKDDKSALVQSYCTGCTMVFNKIVVDYFSKYKPKTLILHDLWIFHMCVLFGEVIFDNNSYILYRQHDSNLIGANNTVKTRLKNKLKSFKSILKQHYREIEAKSILETYKDNLSPDQYESLIILAQYRSRMKYRLFLLFSKKYRMNKLFDNFWFKIRVIIGAV